MKTLFIETKRKFKDSDVELSILDNLSGKTVSLAATIQYIELIPKVKEYLESKGKKVILKKGAYYEGHVLGCNSSALDNSADTLLMITDGKFHAMNNAIQLQKEILVFTGRTLEKIEQKEIDTHNKKTETKKKKYLMAKKVGLLVSTKYGQHQKAISKIAEKIEKSGKETYLFESNNIDTSEFENFPQIQMWINTACFGLARDDMRIINLADILEFIS
jgi:diphthamide biosynthesis enzyme Dph1/Dph2-like protein